MKLSEMNNFNFADYIGKGALLTVKRSDGKVNTMTVSWGTSGVLWNKEVCTVFVRPQRYTHEFCENSSIFTLSFFGKERRDTLSFCGTKTGRDVDKFATCGLNYSIKNDACIFDDAKVTLVLKKLFKQDMTGECFLDEAPLSNYKNNDFHTSYTCEIIDIIVK